MGSWDMGPPNLEYKKWTILFVWTVIRSCDRRQCSVCYLFGLYSVLLQTAVFVYYLFGLYSVLVTDGSVLCVICLDCIPFL